VRRFVLRDRVAIRFDDGLQCRQALRGIGALILSEFLEILDRDALVVSDWGIREGIILEALASEPEPHAARS
jgi:exopolyphosphatase/pppGpp-phosphohydrolase